MEKDMIILPPDATTKEAVDLLAESRSSYILVTEHNFLMGLISESDIVQVAKMMGVFNN